MDILNYIHSYTKKMRTESQNRTIGVNQHWKYLFNAHPFYKLGTVPLSSKYSVASSIESNKSQSRLMVFPKCFLTNSMVVLPWYSKQSWKFWWYSCLVIDAILRSCLSYPAESLPKSIQFILIRLCTIACHIPGNFLLCLRLTFWNQKKPPCSHCWAECNEPIWNFRMCKISVAW